MISAAHVQMMARYNAWQNRSLVVAAGALEDAARRADRGGFWGGIQTTLVHVLWGDGMWMSRFDGWDRPTGKLADSARTIDDWQAYCAARADADRRIADWAGRVTPEALGSELTWVSGVTGQAQSRPLWELATHFFNHQTHHRGQVHAMLTAAGARPDDTDLFLMPVPA